jgi:hypothetical protein
MAVDDAITAYDRIAKEVFSETKYFFQDGAFKASKLERAIKKIVGDNSASKDPQELMKDPLSGDAICRTCVGFKRTWPTMMSRNLQLCLCEKCTESGGRYPCSVPDVRQPRRTGIDMQNLGGGTRYLGRADVLQAHRDRCRAQRRC